MGLKDLLNRWMPPDPQTRLSPPPGSLQRNVYRDNREAHDTIHRTLAAERAAKDARATTKSGGTKHTKACATSRGADASGKGGDYRTCRTRPTPGCPRCSELAGGAAAREGWMG